LRTLGIVIIFLSCSCFGYALSAAQKRRLCAGKAFLSLVKNIRNSINYFGTPLGQIYQKNDCSAIGRDFERELKSAGISSAYTKYGADLPKSPSTEPVLRDFTDKLGKNSPEEELKLCDAFIEQYGSFLEKEGEECEKKQKLYLSMGILVGVMAVILLW